MPKDKDGRPILTDHDWKTDNDRKKESPAVTIWGAIWRAFLSLGLIAIVGLAFFYWTLTEEERERAITINRTDSNFRSDIGNYRSTFVYFRGQCPNCKRRRAIEETGATKSTYRGFWSGTDQENEYKCKYCGDRRWVVVSNDSGGGGG